MIGKVKRGLSSARRRTRDQAQRIGDSLEASGVVSTASNPMSAAALLAVGAGAGAFFGTKAANRVLGEQMGHTSLLEGAARGLMDARYSPPGVTYDPYAGSAGVLAMTGIGMVSATVGAKISSRVASSLPGPSFTADASSSTWTKRAVGAANRAHAWASHPGTFGVLGGMAAAAATTTLTSRAVNRLSQRMLLEGSAGFKVQRPPNEPQTRRRVAQTTTSGVARQSGAVAGWSGSAVMQLHKTGGRGGVYTGR